MSDQCSHAAAAGSRPLQLTPTSPSSSPPVLNSFTANKIFKTGSKPTLQVASYASMVKGLVPTVQGTIQPPSSSWLVLRPTKPTKQSMQPFSSLKPPAATLDENSLNAAPALAETPPPSPLSHSVEFSYMPLTPIPLEPTKNEIPELSKPLIQTYPPSPVMSPKQLSLKGSPQLRPLIWPRFPPAFKKLEKPQDDLTAVIDTEYSDYPVLPPVTSSTRTEANSGVKSSMCWAAAVKGLSRNVAVKRLVESHSETEKEREIRISIMEQQEEEEAVKAAVDAKTVELEEFLASKTQLSVLRHCLGIELFEDAPPLLHRAIGICFDTEGWTADSQKICEVGINMFAVKDMLEIEDVGPHGENLMRNLWFYHIRVTENAHLINIGNCPGNPEANRYGTTRFVNLAETRLFLNTFFGQPMDETKPELGYRPVILLGHALGSDLNKLKTTIRWDPYAFGNVVKVVDTQQVARDCGLWDHHNDQIGLQKLSVMCHVKYRDAHTANNDAAMTTWDLFQMAIYGPAVLRLDERIEDGKTVQDVIEEIEIHSKSQVFEWGSAMCCFRCGSLDHMELKDNKEKRCRVKVCCEHCLGDERTTAKSFSHNFERCIMFALANGNSKRFQTAGDKERNKKRNWKLNARMGNLGH